MVFLVFWAAIVSASKDNIGVQVLPQFEIVITKTSFILASNQAPFKKATSPTDGCIL